MKQRHLPPLARRLLVLGKTQTDLAQDLRVTQQTISGYVTGTMRPKPKRIRPLAIALDLTPAELVDLIAAGAQQ